MYNFFNLLQVKRINKKKNKIGNEKFVFIGPNSEECQQDERGINNPTLALF